MRGSKESRVRNKIRRGIAKIGCKYEAESLDIVASKEVEDVEIFAERIV